MLSVAEVTVKLQLLLTGKKAGQHNISVALIMNTESILRKSYLTDEQSRRMSHLFGSTCVYLYDIEQGAFIPVTVTDKAHEYKTFKNQGRQLVSYVLNVRLAQNRIRR